MFCFFIVVHLNSFIKTVIFMFFSLFLLLFSLRVIILICIFDYNIEGIVFSKINFNAFLHPCICEIMCMFCISVSYIHYSAIYCHYHRLLDDWLVLLGLFPKNLCCLLQIL